MSEEHAIPKAGAPGRYLRNCWYVAGWADELGESPQAKTFLDEPVALFRDADGIAHAIAGRCPHRFAPLGHGQVVDGALQCPYHGLRFDGAGACVFNPHESGVVPRVSVPVYPLAERHNLLWIWMGEADRADEAMIPDFAWLADERWEPVRGHRARRRPLRALFGQYPRSRPRQFRPPGAGRQCLDDRQAPLPPGRRHRLVRI